jgi:hypothetical protein
MTTGSRAPEVRAVQSPASRSRRLRHLLRTRVSEHPAVYLAFARRKYPGPSPEVIGPETELVIDGYTRSATTFAVYAFQLAQARPVRLAHHLHAPAQLIAATRRQVPVLALIREPEGAILSQLAREPDWDMRDALITYTRFYTCLLPYRTSFVVGEFNEVTNDFGAMVRRLNSHFGTSFKEFVHSEGNLRECFNLVRERPTLWSTLLAFESGLVTLDELRSAWPRRPQRPQGPVSRETWMPSTERERTKAALRERWRRQDLAKLRSAAEAAYREFVAEVGAASTGRRQPFRR